MQRAQPRVAFAGATRLPKLETHSAKSEAAYLFLIVSVTVGACWRMIDIGFLSDDFILVRRALQEPVLLLPMFTSGGGDGFF